MISARKLVAALKRAGFEEAKQRGSHLYLWHATKKIETCVPMHSGDLKRSLVKAVLMQARLTEEDLRVFL